MAGQIELPYVPEKISVRVPEFQRAIGWECVLNNCTYTDVVRSALRHYLKDLLEEDPEDPPERKTWKQLEKEGHRFVKRRQGFDITAIQQKDGAQ